MNVKFASCALTVIAYLLLSCVNGQGWTLPGAYTSAGVYPSAPGGKGTPGARYSVAQWQDGNGNIWIFGGYGYGADTSSQGDLSDLWMSSATNASSWTYWGGGSSLNSAPSGSPGPRHNAATWTDSAGTNLYLFGGYFQSNNAYYADLWKYSTASNTWTQIGNNAVNFAGTYPTSGTTGSGQPPGASGQSTWVSGSNFWMFGGVSQKGDYNDLWKLTISGNTPTWTWLNGAQRGTTTPIADTNSQPGTRSGGLDFPSPSSSPGTLWLFGGISGLTTGASAYNDMYTYTISSNTWTFVAGTQTLNSGGSGSVGNTGVPKARGYAASWTDTQGTFWLFGGLVQSSSLTDDFWKFSPSSNVFTWVSGTTNSAQQDRYTSPIYPGSRANVASWVDNIGQLWSYNGNGFGGGNSASTLNEFAVYNGAPLLTTSSVSTSSTSAATVASTSLSSATSSTSGVASTSSTASVGAANLAATTSGSTTAVASTSSVSTTSTTTALVSSSTASVAGTLSGNAASTSSTFGASTSTVGVSSSSSTTNVASNTQSVSLQTSITASNQATATTQAASSSSTLSTALVSGGSAETTTQASTATTASSSSTISATTSSVATSQQSASTSKVASTSSTLSNSFSSQQTAATASSSSTTLMSQTTNFEILSTTQLASSSSSTSSSTISASSTTSKVSSLSVTAQSSSSSSTTANTKLTTAITLTTTVATTATRSTSSSSSHSTSTSTSLATTSSTTAHVGGASVLTPVRAIVAAFVFGALLL